MFMARYLYSRRGLFESIVLRYEFGDLTMQLDDKTGISCDFCGSAHREDFDYHSFDAHKVMVFNNLKPSLGEMINSKIADSFDVCAGCMEELSFKIVENNSTPNNLCEVSSKVFNGSYVFYYVVISNVSVKMSGQPLVCVKCGKKYSSDPNVCSCGGTKLSKSAIVSAGKRDLEISICDDVYNEWRAKKSLPKSTSWASKS